MATPTTKLEAVNELLTAIGTMPVNTLDAPGSADVAIAVDTIDGVGREVQSRGWWFNSTYNTSFVPAANQVTFPSNVLSVRPSRGTSSVSPETRKFTLREGKAYDPISSSFNFSTTIRADVVYLLDFEDLPESARRYITVRAARIFQTKVLGDETLGVFTQLHEQESWMILEGDEAESNPHSHLYSQRVRRVGRMMRPDPVMAQQNQQQQQR